MRLDRDALAVSCLFAGGVGEGVMLRGGFSGQFGSIRLVHERKRAQRQHEVRGGEE
jgi:hypothetical protein